MVLKRFLTIGLLLLAAVALLRASSAFRAEIFIIPAVGAMLWALGEFAFVLKGIWIASARAPFARCELKVLQPQARLGETIELEVALTPKKPITVTGAKLTLLAHEWARRRTSSATGGTGSTVQYDDEKVKVTEAVDVPQSLTVPFSRKVRMQVPLDHPPTFNGEHDRLYTTVRLDLAIDGRPDVWINANVEVLPEVAA